ncbi:MAG: 2-iminoacetate synthase ThiH [Planctomycetota bacterium]
MINEYLEQARTCSAGAGMAPPTADGLRDVLDQEGMRPDTFRWLIQSDDAVLLEQMAERSRDLTDRYFGRAILLYAPLYISNYCTNHCRYCGYSMANKHMPRKQLTGAQIDDEMAVLKGMGFDSILILTGGDKSAAPVEYIGRSIETARKYFAEILVEVYAMTEEEYGRLVAKGLTGVTIYQETYNERLYRQLHPAGEKRDFHFRLSAPERALKAGVKAINIGALLGLGDPAEDVFMAAMHAGYLMDRYPDAEVSLSVPRLRPAAGAFKPAVAVGDAELVRYILALRLFLPRVGISLSTRESAYMRDNLIGLGITRMSAGSRTTVGGYGETAATAGQFEVADTRTTDQVGQSIRARGYRPEFTNWVRGLP